MPGGASGVRLKLNGPCMSAWADSFGLMWEDRSKLSVSIACGSSRSHR